MDPSHYMRQLQEADSAAENLMVLSGEPEEEEEVQTSEPTTSDSSTTRRQRIVLMETESEMEQIEADTFLNTSAKAKSKPTVVAGKSTNLVTRDHYHVKKVCE